MARVTADDHVFDEQDEEEAHTGQEKGERIRERRQRGMECADART